MFIRRIKIGNFMIHRSTELTLWPMTVLIGPNNSGKSAIFDSLLNLSAICRDPIRSAFPAGPYSYRSRHHNGGNTDEPISFDVDLAPSEDSDTYFRYVVSYRQTRWSAGKADYEVTDERLVHMPTGDVLFDRTNDTLEFPEIREFLDTQTGFFAALRAAYTLRKLPRDGAIAAVATGLARFGKYRLDPSILNKPAPLPEILSSDAGSKLPVPRMRYQGEGLAGLLYFLDRTRDPGLDAIVTGAQSALDGFEGFEFNAVPNEFVGFSVHFGDSRGNVEAPNLSAGTLNLIGWLTLLTREDRQPLLMLEEPEMGLTPRSTLAVYEAAKQAAAGGQERSQVLITSHSPNLLAWAARDFGTDHAFVVSPHDGEAAVETYDEALERDGLGIGFDRAMAVETANQVMHGF